MAHGKRKGFLLALLVTLIALSTFSLESWAQSAGSGALVVTVLDSSGATVADAQVTVTSQATGETQVLNAGPNGIYHVPLLPPGSYDVQTEKTGFKTDRLTGVVVVVAETTTLSIKLQVGALSEKIEVTADAELAQTESSALGRAVNQNDLNNLPLVARNYQEILTLSPGIAADVPNATQLGSGSGNAVHSHGARATDDSFEMNGVDVNDLFSGGTSNVPIPNPDSIEEFKVQTGQYDASYGRNAGANVQIVTKSGTNDFHGAAFEYFRNNVLNANDFFANLAGTPRPVLNENQFGGTVGGPIQKDKLFFFGSYQGTRQIDGADPQCESSVILPLLTNDRSALGIATLFNGQRGALQNELQQAAGLPFPLGPAIDDTAPNGSSGPAPPPFGGSDTNPYNVSPVAFALLNLKLPNGDFYIPNPQVTSGSLAGLSVFTNPCRFNEDQYVTNVDYFPAVKSRVSVKYFLANDNQTTFFENGGVAGFSQILPGSPQSTTNRFQNASVTYSYTFNAYLANEVRAGWGRYNLATLQKNPFTFSSVGVTAPAQSDDLPNIVIDGCCQLGGANDQTLIQNTATLNDSLYYIRGRHTFGFGGGFTHYQTNVRNFRFDGINIYPTFADFLLGLNGTQNGTAPIVPPVGFSNTIASIGFAGQGDRNWRTWDGDAYAQDDIKVTPDLTVNIGVRYEHLGDLADASGRNANFYPNLANANPPAGGTLAGWVVSSNIPSSVALPAGVTKLGNEFGVNGDGQNKVAPRVGFAWQIPRSLGLVLRGGYGIYYSRTVGNATFQLETSPPFSALSVTSGPGNGAATASNPFPASILNTTFPSFPSYSPTTSLSILTLAPNYQPPITQQYSLGLQKSFAHDFLLDVGYVGTRGTKLIVTDGLNQALNATATNPVRGQTSDTVANIGQRLPFLGFESTALGLDQLQNSGWLWYNGLDVSLTKRFSHGLQFLASYTLARDLDTGGADPEGASTGTDTFGNQNRRAQYGPALYTRAQRFVLSLVYEFPGRKNMGPAETRFLGGWGVSSVMTLQSGDYLTLTGSNGNNAFGITSDYIQLAPGCTPGMLVNSGSVKHKLNDYFNGNCVNRANLAAPLDPVANPATWPVIGSDGQATAFGNERVGSVVGPGQSNIDFSLFKATKLRETMTLEFRASFFNLFNAPQFANPDTNTGDTTFGVISGTSVNPRIGQLALKLKF